MKSLHNNIIVKYALYNYSKTPGADPGFLEGGGGWISGVVT